jgi:PEP-CTERM motif
LKFSERSKEMKRNMLSFVFLATLLAGALGSIGTAQAILFTGNTNTSSPTTINTFLTYTGASFVNIDVPIGPGPTSLTNLGTFTLNVCGSINCDEPFGSQDGVADFTLRITFTDPVVSGSPALFTSDIFGTILRSGNSNNIGSGSLLTIDFVNAAQHLSYSNALGTGAFDISVNDPASYTAASQFGDTRTVTGQIANLSFTPSGSPTAAVPEPASLLLFAVGFGGLPFLRKRQRLDN